MRKQLTLALIIGLLSFESHASEAENQAQSFATIYASLCMKHLMNLEELREKLRPVPRLPPEKASYFLSGASGDAWSVPDKHGSFVLALPHGKNLCAVFARRADTRAAEKRFVEQVSSAPLPLSAKKMAGDRYQSASNGPVQTIAYEWAIPKATRKMQFVLTTAASDTAQIQAMATASVAGTEVRR